MRVSRIYAFALVVVLTIELTIWEDFLIAARPFGEPLPLSGAIALVANFLLVRAGTRLRGTVGAVVPLILWVALVGAASTYGPGRDILGPTLVQYRLLALFGLGGLGGVLGVFAGTARRTPIATPEVANGR